MPKEYTPMYLRRIYDARVLLYIELYYLGVNLVKIYDWNTPKVPPS